FLGVVLASTPAWAQSNQLQIDSLQTLLKTASEDANKARIYGLLSWYYVRSHDHTDIARLYADSTMALSQKLGDLRRVALAHYYYGTIDRYEGNYEKALEHLDKHIAYFR